MSEKTYKVPICKLDKYLIKAMRDLFSCEEFADCIDTARGKDEFGVPNTTNDRTFTKSVSSKCSEISINFERLQKFINLYHFIQGTDISDVNFLNTPENERRIEYPTREEFEFIALYVEKRSEYQPIFDMFDKENEKEEL